MSKQFKQAKEFADLSKDLDMVLLRDSIRECFKDFPNPRKTDRVLYPGWYVLLIIILGVLSNCDCIADIAEFAQWRKDLLEELIGIKIGVPKYDAFRNMLVFTKPEGLKALTKIWFDKAPEELKEKLLVIDGKRIKRASKQGSLTHIVELFSAEDRLVVAQEKVPDKKGEKAGLENILDKVDTQGAIVSLDALFTTTEIAQVLRNKQTDYIMAVKANQRKLYDEISNFFQQAKDVQYKHTSCEIFEDIEKGHGRIEKRTICITSTLDWLPQRANWKELKSIIEVSSEREFKGKIERFTRYYISSCINSPKQFAQWIRDHWSIENSLHWVLDVIFKEDSNGCYTGHAAENLSIIKRFVLNILRTYQPLTNLASARKAASFEPLFLKTLAYKMFVK